VTYTQDEKRASPVRPECDRVLIVEDEHRLRDMLLANLREMSLEGAGAGSAEQAMRIMAATPYPIVVLDLNLPGMGGMDLCEVIHQRWPGTQVIILSGFGDLDAAKRAIRLDVVDFLTKPCGMDDLEFALSRARQRWMERWLADPPATRDKPEKTRSEPEPVTHKVRTSDEPVKKVAPPLVVAGAPAAQSPVSLQEMERQLILAALARHAGNREAAATELGISLRKLYYRIQQYQQAGYL
jgi:DNA-binding NtrC family response regulator